MDGMVGLWLGRHVHKDLGCGKGMALFKGCPDRQRRVVSYRVGRVSQPFPCGAGVLVCTGNKSRNPFKVFVDVAMNKRPKQHSQLGNWVRGRAQLLRLDADEVFFDSQKPPLRPQRRFA